MNKRDNRDFRKWVEQVQRELVPKIRDSAFVMSLVPTGEVDVKFAVELGLSIMLDKPILACVTPGSKIPQKLAAVVDRFVEMDMNDPTCKERMAAAIKEFAEGTETP